MPDQIPLTDGQVRALGELAYHSAQVENLLEVIHHELIDEDPAVGAAMTEGMASARRIDQIKLLIPFRGEHELFTPRLQENLEWARELLAERNGLLHSRWVQIEDGAVVQVRGKKVSSRRLLQISEEDLEDSARHMAMLARGLELDWCGLVIHLGRTTPVPGSDQLVYTPNRWGVDGEIEPPRSSKKSPLDLYAEGRISRDEYLALTEGKGG